MVYLSMCIAVVTLRAWLGSADPIKRARTFAVLDGMGVCLVEVLVGGRLRWPGCRDRARRGQRACALGGHPPGRPGRGTYTGLLGS